jgi:hypothetical protein
MQWFRFYNDYLYFMAPRFAKGVKLKERPFPKPLYAARPLDEQGSPLCEAGATPAGRSNLPEVRRDR